LSCFHVQEKAESEKSMKQAAKSAPSTATPRLDAARGQMAGVLGTVERSRAYSDATAILLRLQVASSEHAATLGNLKARATRLEETARRYIEREGLICMAGDVTAVAKELIAGGDLRQVISAARVPLEKSVYSALRFPETGDLEQVKEIDFERACVLALDHAIKLQKATIELARKAAISELNLSLASSRAIVARGVLAGLKTLNELADQDRCLAEQMDPADLALLSPPPFPATRILSDHANNWFIDCVKEGLIEDAEISVLGLR
jgi:hypothetical protein